MKQILVVYIIAIAAFSASAVGGQPPPPVQPYTAVVWTATTLYSPSGKATVFMQRTVHTRDASGNTRLEMYGQTKGLQHDTNAPLEHVFTGSTSRQPTSAPHSAPALHSSKETLEQQTDLGTLQFSGLPATGWRQTFVDANGQQTHTFETWFNATLGLTVHMESRNARRDTVVSDLSELHLDNPATPSAADVPAAWPAIPLLRLYRGLFTHIAHMEQNRLANDPNLHVNFAQVEDHLAKQMGLSADQWQVVVDISLKVATYTTEKSKEARSFADQDRAARHQNPLGANTIQAGRAKLHGMQLDLNTQVQGDIDQLKASVGKDATGRIEAYLQGPLAASTSAVPFKLARHTQTEQPR